MNYHRLFQKKSKKCETYISIKVGSISEIFITKMLSAKFSRNPESFIGFGRSRCIDLAISHGYTHIPLFNSQHLSIVLPIDDQFIHFFLSVCNLNFVRYPRMMFDIKTTHQLTCFIANLWVLMWIK